MRLRALGAAADRGLARRRYAHVVTDPDHPGKLALQYWFFYPYNHWNNLHEGDWEMIQLVFDADDAKEALGVEPAEIGYSQHEGAERAGWDDDKLERIGEHPVVYPGAGSHANYFDQALHVGSSAEQGVGCDDTQGPHVELNPTVLTIPSDPPPRQAAFPWLAYEGRWGELQHSIYNGPTGPNLKDAMDGSRSRGSRRTGGRRATRSRPAASSGRARRTSSAAPSRRARSRSRSCSAARRRC